MAPSSYYQGAPPPPPMNVQRLPFRTNPTIDNIQSPPKPYPHGLLRVPFAVPHNPHPQQKSHSTSIYNPYAGSHFQSHHHQNKHPTPNSHKGFPLSQSYSGNSLYRRVHHRNPRFSYDGSLASPGGILRPPSSSGNSSTGSTISHGSSSSSRTPSKSRSRSSGQSLGRSTNGNMSMSVARSRSQSQIQGRRVSFAEERGTLIKRTPSATPDRSTGQFEFVDDRSGPKIINNSGSGSNERRRQTGKQQQRGTGRSLSLIHI